MGKLNPQDPRHQSLRNTLRLVGPIIFGIGVVLVVISAASLMGGVGNLFFLGFIGLPLMFVGGVMCQFGFLGALYRYAASEGAPVASETFNYMADETKESVKTIAGAVGEGLREGMGGHKACPKCGARCDVDSRFCKACGAAVT
jgi:hypothetical protein